MRPPILSVLLLAAASAMAGPTITVTSPRADVLWCLGQRYAVTWRSSGFTSNVAIVLMRDGVALSKLAASTANDGAADVVVPATVAPGDAVIRVHAIGGAPHGDSAVFRVGECLQAVAAPAPRLSAMPSIRVTQPAAGQQFVLGNVLDVRWTSSGAVPDTPFGITLESPGCTREVKVLRPATPNDGTERVLCPPDVPAGEYSVKVGIFRGIQACSGTFRLNDILTITEPGAATVLHPGDRFTVRWRSSLGGALQLALVPDGTSCWPRTALASSTPNDGAEALAIPASTAPGAYRIAALPIGGRWADVCMMSASFRVVTGR